MSGLSRCANVNCNSEGEDMPAEKFYKDSSRRTGLSVYCKACTRARVAKKHGTMDRDFLKVADIVSLCGKYLNHERTGIPLTVAETVELIKRIALKQEMERDEGMPSRIQQALQRILEEDQNDI